MLIAHQHKIAGSYKMEYIMKCPMNNYYVETLSVLWIIKNKIENKIFSVIVKNRLLKTNFTEVH